LILVISVARFEPRTTSSHKWWGNARANDTHGWGNTRANDTNGGGTHSERTHIRVSVAWFETPPRSWLTFACVFPHYTWLDVGATRIWLHWS